MPTSLTTDSTSSARYLPNVGEAYVSLDAVPPSVAQHMAQTPSHVQTEGAAMQPSLHATSQFVDLGRHDVYPHLQRFAELVQTQGSVSFSLGQETFKVSRRAHRLSVERLHLQSGDADTCLLLTVYERGGACARTMHMRKHPDLADGDIARLMDAMSDIGAEPRAAREAMEGHPSNTVPRTGPLELIRHAPPPRATRPSEQNARHGEHPEDAVVIKLSHSRDGRIKVIDSSDSAAMKWIKSVGPLFARVGNLDGVYDETATTASAAAPVDVQPILIPVVDTLISPLALLSAVDSAKAASKSYGKKYPDQVRRVLDEQAYTIEALSERGAKILGETNDDLAELIHLHMAGLMRYEERVLYRKEGKVSLHRYNGEVKRSGQAGNGALSQAFNRELNKVLAQRKLRDPRLIDPETSFRRHMLNDAEWNRGVAKRMRYNKALAAVSLSGVFMGIQTSTGSHVAMAVEQALDAKAAASGIEEALHTTAAATAGTVLEAMTSGIFLASQLLQTATGIANAHIDQMQLERLKVCRDALIEMKDQLPEETLGLYLSMADAEKISQQVYLAIDVLLATGQGLMAAGTLTGALDLGTVSVPCIIIGAIATIGASVGRSVTERRQAKFQGNSAHHDLKQQLAFDSRATGLRLRTSTLDKIIEETGDELRQHQAHAIRARMHHDILQAIEKEDILSPQKTASADALYRRLVKGNNAKHARRSIFVSGQQVLEKLRREAYPPVFFTQSTLDIHKALATSLRQHPRKDRILKLPDYKAAVYMGVLKELAKMSDPGVRALFINPVSKAPLEELLVDGDFENRVQTSEIASRILLKHSNIQMARFTMASNLYGRHSATGQLEHLALSLRRHRTMVPEDDGVINTRF